MLFKLCQRWLRDRRGATAMIFAITLVPMMIAGVTGVDMARVSAARTVLQGAVDAAAIAGGGAWNTNGSSTAAISTARAAYAGATATLGAMTASLTPSTASTLVTVYCNTASTTASCGTVTADTTGTCPTSNGTASYQYCVVVRASLSIGNLLAAWILPTTGLTAQAVDTVGTANYSVNPGDFSSTSVGSASDHSDILTYVVPSTSSGAADFATLPAANSACTYSTTGVIADGTLTTATNGTACNYERIGSSTGASGSGTLSFSSGNYVAFAFANMVGATSTYGVDGTYKYQTAITVASSANGQGTTYANGYAVNNGTQTCSYYYGYAYNCTNNTTALYGECPAHNLYGGITQGTDGTMVVNNATSADSLTVYSSAFEMLGYPVTHGVNHTLPSFTTTTKEKINNTTYYVTVTCPNWPTTAAQATADGNSSFVPTDTNITAYATYYPDVTYPTNGTSVYPPSLQSGCSPAASYPTLGTATTNSAWWGWSPSNTGYCANQPTTSSGAYDPTYNNCALVIEPLGSGVPTTSGAANLPSYYVEVEDSQGNVLALDPIYDNASFTDIYPGVLNKITNAETGFTITATDTSTSAVTLKDTNSTSFYPTQATSWAITAGTYKGDTAYLDVPEPNGSGSYTSSLPPSTSHRCYNPQQNGFTQASFTDANNNNGTPIDHVANPQDGAVDCSKYSGYSFGLYWNDLGSNEQDDLGYWNAVTVFTCPTPTYTTGASAPSTLSG